MRGFGGGLWWTEGEVKIGSGQLWSRDGLFRDRGAVLAKWFDFFP